jgi:hypothetical protein
VEVHATSMSLIEDAEGSTRGGEEELTILKEHRVERMGYILGLTERGKDPRISWNRLLEGKGWYKVPTYYALKQDNSSRFESIYLPIYLLKLRMKRQVLHRPERHADCSRHSTGEHLLNSTTGRPPLPNDLPIIRAELSHNRI